MTTIASPASHAQLKGDLGFAYTFAAEEIRERLQDRLAMEQLGWVQLVGDVAGTGSDVLRITDIGDLGYARPFTELANETSTITPSPFLTGYSTVTVGMYGLSHDATYFSQILTREGAVTLDSIKREVPKSVSATVRSLVATKIAAFGTNVGDTSSELGPNDFLDLGAAFRANLGAYEYGVPACMVHPQQVEQAIRGFRNDPAYQKDVREFQEMAALRTREQSSQLYRNFMGLGMDLAASDDVSTTGGGYDGGAWSFGGIAMARASTAGLVTANPNGTMYVPEAGLVIEEAPETGRTGTRRYYARLFIGVDSGSTNVFVLRGLISKTTSY